MTGAEQTPAEDERLARLAAGTVLHLAQTDWKYGRHPLLLRVTQVRPEISVHYGSRWVWISGEQLAPDGRPMGHLDALVRVAALPLGPNPADPADPAAPTAGPCHDDDHDQVKGGGSMIASLECVVLDCPDVRALAEFYRSIVGGAVNRPDPRWSVDDDWATLHTAGGLVLCFQRVRDYRPPVWPDPARPQQFHLDFGVPAADLAEAEREVLARGATLLDGDRPWRVYADPAGHPFCLVPHG